MKKILQKSIELVNSTTDKITDEISSKVSLVKELVNQLPVFISLESSDKYNEQQYDEKHYFVIPFMLSDTGIALHTMRCLPNGVYELNDLPKRRIFHFANKHAEVAIRTHLLEQTVDEVRLNHENKVSGLESLANDIDKLDKKLTYGMLLVGGVTALVNPVVGVGIAAKAILPGIGGLVSKYTLRPMGEKLSESKLQSDTKAAQNKIIKEFESAETLQIINPILQELELALNTTESEHDPLFDFNLGDGSIHELADERWRELSVIALKHVYIDVLNDKSKHQAASLGPEDIRWLKLLFNN